MSLAKLYRSLDWDPVRRTSDNEAAGKLADMGHEMVEATRPALVVFPLAFWLSHIRDPAARPSSFPRSRTPLSLGLILLHVRLVPSHPAVSAPHHLTTSSSD